MPFCGAGLLAAGARCRPRPPAGQPAAPPRRSGPASAASTMPPPRAAAAGRLGAGRPVIAPCFEAQGDPSVIEPQTYLYYIQLKPSRPSQGVWIPYDDAAEKTIQEDFHRLWNTNFLDNLSIDVSDYTFPNGTIGKIVTYNMEERQRVKIVDYVGSKKVEVVEDRREAEGRERGDPPRHLHRSRPGPQGRGHRPRHAAREGLPVRRRHARDQGRCPAGRSWCTSPSTWTKGRRSRSEDRLRRQQGDQRRHAEAPDEGEQGARPVHGFHRIFPTWFLR